MGKEGRYNALDINGVCLGSVLAQDWEEAFNKMSFVFRRRKDVRSDWNRWEEAGYCLERAGLVYRPTDKK